MGKSGGGTPSVLRGNGVLGHVGGLFKGKLTSSVRSSCEAGNLPNETFPQMHKDRPAALSPAVAVGSIWTLIPGDSSGRPGPGEARQHPGRWI